MNTSKGVSCCLINFSCKNVSLDIDPTSIILLSNVILLSQFGLFASYLTLSSAEVLQCQMEPDITYTELKREQLQCILRHYLEFTCRDWGDHEKSVTTAESLTMTQHKSNITAWDNVLHITLKTDKMPLHSLLPIMDHGPPCQLLNDWHITHTSVKILFPMSMLIIKEAGYLQIQSTGVRT